MAKPPAWQSSGALKMIRGRNGLILVAVVVSLLVIFNISDLLPASSLSGFARSEKQITIPVSNELSQTLDAVSPSSNASAASGTSTPTEMATGTLTPTEMATGTSPTTEAALKYYGQVFEETKPEYGFPDLTAYCAATTWREDEVFLRCNGMSAGITTIISQLKVCLKMAVETGTNIILPSMPLRDSTNLQEFNFMNSDAYMPYDQWFDVQHLIEGLNKACPRMKIVHPDDLDSEQWPVKYEWHVSLNTAPQYVPFLPLFWPGKPFRTFFNSQLAGMEYMAKQDPDKDDSKKGITIVLINSAFLLFRIMDDPTRGDLRLWNDLGLLIRFRQDVRSVVGDLMDGLKELGDERGYYGVHFRVESDSMWSSLENQLASDLDALDEAWAAFGEAGDAKPLVYLACGDQTQVAKFVEAGAERGWDVVHKWALAQAPNAADKGLMDRIGKMPFDFQGAVDMGVMVKAGFFMGIIGSAFSSSIGNVRDVTGRYRGSSLGIGAGLIGGDEGARTHLFNDRDAGSYACCL